jgi:hypothetical protein
MKYWSTGVLDFESTIPLLHHSSTPIVSGYRKANL